MKRLPPKAGGADSGDNETTEPETPTVYTITNNLTNVTSNNNATEVEAGDSYEATLTADDGYEISSIIVEVGGEDVTEYVGLTDGYFYIGNVGGDIVITAIAEKVASNGKIYVFDSTSSSNFLFGEYHYKEYAGSVNEEAETSWPPSNDEDGLNTDASKIILQADYNTLLKPTGASPAWLCLEANYNGFFANNNSYIYNGTTYEPCKLGVPLEEVTLHVNAYCTDSGYATITYNDDSTNQITVTGTTLTEYSMSITLVSNAFFDFNSVEGCGNFVITDIWFE